MLVGEISLKDFSGDKKMILVLSTQESVLIQIIQLRIAFFKIKIVKFKGMMSIKYPKPVKHLILN